ncbi:pumilio-family RNA binding repeat domain-containing protein [Trichoderma breve]|uniref:Pumilio-family RNA binding repeat domain-containing protein n=1 Tax=Trichoderma breve TaxID=2034170 RepID=A0A9W9B9F6_9HYPO|nr:pumilio-family RNA binding repeat domain-containing protein [Trichoderma breve]KAJ4859062.1 pumilio-family RNA binding repeat domain-containing protein [Trichoderma breve]
MSTSGSSGSTPQRSVTFSAGTPLKDMLVQAGNVLSATVASGYTFAYFLALGNWDHVCDERKGHFAIDHFKVGKPRLPKVRMKHVHNLPTNNSYHMEKPFARMPEQVSINQQNQNAKVVEDEGSFLRVCDQTPSSTSLPITPVTEGFSATAPTTRPASVTLDDSRPDTEEVFRLKLQLAQARNHISKLDQELAQSRSAKESDTAIPRTETAPRENIWSRGTPDDTQSDTSDSASATALNRARGIWGSTKAPFANNNSLHPPAPEPSPAHWFGGRGFNQGCVDPNSPYILVDNHRPERQAPDHDIMRPPSNRRGARFDNRMNPSHQFGASYVNLNGPAHQFDSVGGPVPVPVPAIGTPLSPHASEFTSKAGWKNEVVPSEGPTYLPPTEPLNYRRLLDRNLKVGTPEQKYEIVEAIVAQAYPLMVNRFGNFLVQRCFEHGTPEQVIKIAEAIRGNTLNLSMDPFGCHVVQKAFDSVPEEYKAIMVHELLRRIPETVIHRYACHVWQKLFELRWTESPPQIMKFVNESLRGMWHEVALGETGSLVVQNIFENCLEEDKRPCIEEVLANIDIVAHGQFGNWCIQHICEHGAPPDRSRAIDHVIRYAAEYSTDQFASKVVEKCLKIGSAEFLGRYLDRVCEGRRDRTRIPLIDIASDQYGNYLIQWILNNASPQHREMVAAHIRKHMVSLRGSKFGSRVGMLCTNHAVTTRPGPGVGPGMSSSRIGGPGPARFGTSYR